MIDKLSVDLVEEGRAHPFVEALVAEMSVAHANRLHELEAKAASGDTDGTCAALGGRCAELRHWLRIINGATGVDE